MDYELAEVSERAEFDGISDVIWAAMESVDSSHPIFFPVIEQEDNQNDTNGTDNIDARTRAIAQGKSRMWNEHVADPSSHWIFVRETESRLIVAGCQWRFYAENPFGGGSGGGGDSDGEGGGDGGGKKVMPRITADWWPKGPGREFASEVVNQCFRLRCVTMARPHAGLSYMCVRPEHQRRGLGRLLLQWGLQRADDMKLESFIEATPQGKLLYKTFGFKSVREFNVGMSGVDDSVRKQGNWAELERSLLPIGYTAMWRPVLGVWNPDEPGRTFDPRLEEYERSLS